MSNRLIADWTNRIEFEVIPIVQNGHKDLTAVQRTCVVIDKLQMLRLRGEVLYLDQSGDLAGGSLEGQWMSDEEEDAEVCILILSLQRLARH